MAEDPFGLVGQAIDEKYRIDQMIGEGGFGVVYRGFHLDFEQPIAVKCLKVPAHFTGDARQLFLDKFRAEGQHLAKLAQHPSVIRVYAFGVAPSPMGAQVPYLVLEWLEGQDLEQLLAERSRSGTALSEGEALTFLRPAIEAIAFAHQLGIAHRDIKPPNLFWAETPRGPILKVLDFGIAKAMQEGDTATQLTTKTSSGFSAFSPQYGAPEQFQSSKFGATGPWTDVYALALVLVELVAGRAAFEGEGMADFLLASLAEQRPTPRAIGVDASDGFEQLCAQALTRAPAQRFEDAGQLLAAVDELLSAPAGASASTGAGRLEPWSAALAPATGATPPQPPDPHLSYAATAQAQSSPEPPLPHAGSTPAPVPPQAAAAPGPPLPHDAGPTPVPVPVPPPLGATPGPLPNGVFAPPVPAVTGSTTGPAVLDVRASSNVAHAGGAFGAPPRPGLQPGSGGTGWLKGLLVVAALAAIALVASAALLLNRGDGSSDRKRGTKAARSKAEPGRDESDSDRSGDDDPATKTSSSAGSQCAPGDPLCRDPNPPAGPQPPRPHTGPQPAPPNTTTQPAPPNTTTQPAPPNTTTQPSPKPSPKNCNCAPDNLMCHLQCK